MVSDTVPDTLDISALIRSLKAGEPSKPLHLIETHISWVLINPTWAYKIKKPVKFPFVDFRNLSQRKHFCEEEVRLNKRLAPDLYKGAVPIVYWPRQGLWSIDPSTPVDAVAIVDWAVKMRAFNANATLDRTAEVLPAQIDAIADAVAAFHLNENPLSVATPFGSTAEITRITTENLNEISSVLPKDPRLLRLCDSTNQRLKTLVPFFEQRKANGAIKECHGDLHLGNIAWENDKPIIFDCIEFTDTLRCIDVINEIAFLFMDLHAKGQSAMAWRFLNRWLEHTGDYEGLNGLMFYASYRALVRAKISKHQGKVADSENYFALAERFTAPQRATLTLMHGFSGSGKTFESQRLLETEGAVRIRSDVERKRLHGLTSASLSDSALRIGLYQEAATRETFNRLERLAGELLASGFHVIVDATFLKRSLRQQFISLGQRLNVPVRIVNMAVSPDVCRQRILARFKKGVDASEATLDVLAHQLEAAEPFSPEEIAFVKVSGTVSDTVPDTF